MSVADNQNDDGRLGGDNAKPGQLPLVTESVGCVIDADMEKIKALTAKGQAGVQELATYLKGLLNEGVVKLTVAALNEGENPFAKKDDDSDDDKGGKKKSEDGEEEDDDADNKENKED